jgi:hypothetical protein
MSGRYFGVYLRRKKNEIAKIWEKLGKFQKNLGKSGKSWENLGKVGKIWEKLGKSGKSWENLGKVGKMGKKVENFRKKVVSHVLSCGGNLTVQY